MTFNPFDPLSNNLNDNSESEVAHLVRAVLNNDAGHSLLQVLQQRTILQPVQSPNTESAYGYFREGQNDIVRQLIDITFSPENDESSFLGRFSKIAKNTKCYAQRFLCTSKKFR